MSHTITILDESTAGKANASFILELDARRLRARDLIRQRVRQEMCSKIGFSAHIHGIQIGILNS